MRKQPAPAREVVNGELTRRAPGVGCPHRQTARTPPRLGEPTMHETTIDAIKVREGQTVTRITTRYRTRFRGRDRTQDQGVQQTNGQWPTITNAEYRAKGEGGNPTVYIETSDAPGWDYCLAPDDQVTVQVD